MAATPKPVRRNNVTLRDIYIMRDTDPAPQDVIDAATRIKEDAMMQAALRGCIMMAWGLGVKAHQHIPTTGIPTAAVIALGDGQVVLAYNPAFVVSLKEDGALFVFMHEAYHLLLNHLHAGEHLRTDPKWTTATEAIINYLVMARLKRTDMPSAEVEVRHPVTGKVTSQVQPTGVNPRELHKKYTEAATKAGLQFLDYESFYETHHVTYSELCRVPMDEDQEGGSGGTGTGAGQCIHGTADSEANGPSSDGTSEGVPSDSETTDDVAGQVLAAAIRAAAQGSETAREELLALAGKTEDGSENAKKIWGDLGIARLRGQSHENRRIDWWQRWLKDAMASLLKEGEKLQYVKKRGAIDMVLGRDPMLSRRGEEEVKRVLIALDTSGSMPQTVVEYLTQLVGYTDGVEALWVSFDGIVTLFVPGERVVGGGGTNFANVMDYAEGRLEINGHKLDDEPDAIIMLTDGEADPIRPENPERWIWLITEHGRADWIEKQPQPMDSHRITTGEGI